VWQSTILNAPIAKVWSLIRPLDFVYLPTVATVDLEGKDAHPDIVGGERIVWYTDGTMQRLRLLELSETRHEVTWELVSSEPPTRVLSSIHTVRLRRITESNTTFVEWTTDFSRDASAEVTEDARYKQKENFAALAAEIAKKFTFKTTAEEAIKGFNGTGKVVLITGAAGGLGFETARVFLTSKAHVVAAVRDVEKTTAALGPIAKSNPGSQLTVLPLDLNSLVSVQKFAAQFKALNLPLHILIANAGLMAVKTRQVTEQKIESQFGVNYIAHHLLVNLLLDVLKKSAPARIVLLSSVAHTFGGVNFDDWNFEQKYDKWAAYAQAKTAIVLFAKHLNAQLLKDGANVTVLSVHPGGIAQTDLGRHLEPEDRLRFRDRHFRWKNIPQGAATTVVAATAPEYADPARGGVYFVDCNEAKPAPHANDPTLAQKLYALGEQIIQKMGL